MRFLVLGPLEVAEPGVKAFPIAGSKERTILACLIARAGQVVPVDDLVDELWGDSPPRAPEKTLTSYVSRLRRDLQSGRAAGSNGDVIVFRSGGYALERDGHDIDAVGFEHLASEGHRLLKAGDTGQADRLLAQALDLWRGAAHQRYRYTRFGAAEGDRLDELRRIAAEDLVESRLGSADPGRLVPELEAMVRDEPLRERRWAQLMVALYRAGRQAEALQAFARAREVLVGELGVEPGVELQRLQTAILAHDPDLDRAASSPEPAIDVCPYKGLARFETTDAAFFFGRELVVAEAIGDLVRNPFLALIGPSGSGKSSLLRAGVVHALASGAIPGSERWSAFVIRPGDHPVAALGDALDERSGHTFLAIDQFEEVFTACADLDERTEFLDAITSAAATPDDAVTVTLAMRADFYGHCAEHRPLATLIARHQILVGPMDADELRRAIERPAARAGLTIEDGLVDALVSDTVGQPGALPLLSTALLELWTRRRDRTLRLEDYLRAGGVEGAVARLAEDAFGLLDETEQAAAKRILLRSAAPGDGADVVRRQAPLAEFDLDRDEAAARAMAVLADARLITVSEGTAEVAHEALLREWPRLREWLEEDAEGRRLHAQLTQAARGWNRDDRDRGELYRGARLAAAPGGRAAPQPELNAPEQQFLDGGRVASERARRRIKLVLAGVLALLVLTAGAALLALDQRGHARAQTQAAEAQRLGAQALNADPLDFSLLLARQGVALDDGPATDASLLAAL